MSPDITTTTATAFGSAIVAFGMACFERYRSIKANQKVEVAVQKTTEAEQLTAVHNEILRAKDELIEIAKQTASAQEERFDAEHKEYLEYRQAAHAQLNSANTLALRQAAEIAELKAKTDITEVLHGLKQQESVNEQVLVVLKDISQAQRDISQATSKILDRIEALEAGNPS